MQELHRHSTGNDSSLIDILIINHNSTQFLIQCLDSINAALGDGNAAVYVFDNNSRDDVGAITRRFPRINLIRHPENIGFARAVNKLLNISHAPYVIMLNPDTIVASGFFDIVISYIRENPDVGVLGPQILNTDGSMQGSARSFPSPLTAFFGRNSLMTKIFPRNPVSEKNVLTAISDGVRSLSVDWVSGACMVVRRTAIDATGLMDERFFLYWEDADWCRRMWQNGWKVVYYPRAVITHHVGKSSQSRVWRSELNFHISAYRLYCKYGGTRQRLFKPLVAVGLSLRFLFAVSAGLLKKFK